MNIQHSSSRCSALPPSIASPALLQHPREKASKTSSQEGTFPSLDPPRQCRGSHLCVGRVEVHVVDPAAGRVHPAGAQAILQRLEGDVQADHQVQLTDPIQSLGLAQRARETWPGSSTAMGMRGWQAAGMEPNSSIRQLWSCRLSPAAAQAVGKADTTIWLPEKKIAPAAAAPEM